MSQITNDGFTRSDTGCIIAICTYVAIVGVKGLTQCYTSVRHLGLLFIITEHDYCGSVLLIETMFVV